MSTQTQTNADTSRSSETFVTALVVAVAVGGAQLAAFHILRKRFPKIYSARSELIPEDEKDRHQSKQPDGIFSIIPAIIKANEKDIIRCNGLDAYLFTRFLKLMLWIFAPVSFLSWAILLPVYGTGSTGNQQLERFTFGNIGQDQRARYAAPLILVWVSTAWVLFIIFREWRNYIALRQEFLTSKRWTETAQANTVLITGIPSDECSLESLHHYADAYPGGVARIWLARNPGDLEDAYDRRQDAGKKLEKAQNKAIKQSVKLVKKGKVSSEGNRDQEKNGSVMSRYLPEKKIPTHKLGRVPCVGEKVNTIEWCNEEISTTNKILEDGRQDVQNRYKADCSAFIMFNSQVSAHEFAQNNAKNFNSKKMRMTGRHINAAPGDVIWKNLNVKPADNKIRKVISWAITIVVIIWWAIPVTFVSGVSNVSNLCATVPFLAWLCELPTPINGILQGVLPPVAFALLFMLLPIFLRMLSKYEGTPLNTMVEHSLQKRYFLFLFVHGFIVTTLASGIVAGISQITDDPSAAATILAQQLPSSSVFFLTLIVTNGLSQASGGILQIVRLVLYYVKATLLGSSPRALWNVTYNMPVVRFGQLYPAQLLIAVIALAYSAIAPLVCGFALITFSLWWLCYKYLFLWVNDQPRAGETGGIFFKTALNQLFAGLYIEQLCLIGLFFLARNESNGFAALPQAIIMVVLLIVTIGCQVFLNYRYKTRSVYLPSELRKNEKSISSTDHSLGGTGNSDNMTHFRPSHEDGSNTESVDGQHRFAESGAPLDSAVSHNTTVVNGGGNNAMRGQPMQKGDKSTGHLAGETEDGYSMENAYLNPCFYRNQPTIWIPRDPLGISADQISNSRKHGVDITDEGATINDKAKLDVDRYDLPGQPFDP